MFGRKTKFQSERLMANVYLGIMIAGVNTLIVLASPDTMASIAARTLFEIRLAAMGSAGAGASSTARARLAGVMFSMPATVGSSPPAGNAPPRDVLRFA